MELWSLGAITFKLKVLARRLQRPFFYLIFSLMLPVIMVATLALHDFFYKPLSIGDNYVITVATGDTLGKIALQLQQDEILANTRVLRWFAKFSQLASKIKVGEFLLADKMTAHDILNLLTSSKVKQYPFTIVEGSRLRDILAAMRAHPKIKTTLTLGNEHLEIAQFMDLPEATSAEGLFLPDTYYFVAGTCDLQLLQRAYDAMTELLSSTWLAKNEHVVVLKPYEALIIASIIEKESHFPDEYPLIASVYHRRLAQNMRLQADPTIIYVLDDGNFNGRVLYKHLRMENSYNTYKNSGLPPTPIAMPSKAAIIAALQPADPDYLYFVANQEGRHVFSSDLDTHNAAVATYRQLKAKQREQFKK